MTEAPPLGPAWRGLASAGHCLLPSRGVWRPGPEGPPAIGQMPSDTSDAEESQGKSPPPNTGDGSGLHQELFCTRNVALVTASPGSAGSQWCRQTRVARTVLEPVLLGPKYAFYGF